MNNIHLNEFTPECHAFHDSPDIKKNKSYACQEQKLGSDKSNRIMNKSEQFACTSLLEMKFRK